MKKILSIFFVWIGALFTASIFLLMVIVSLPVYLISEILVYLQKVAQIRSKRSLTEYID